MWNIYIIVAKKQETGNMKVILTQSYFYFQKKQKMKNREETKTKINRNVIKQTLIKLKNKHLFNNYFVSNFLTIISHHKQKQVFKNNFLNSQIGL